MSLFFWEFFYPSVPLVTLTKYAYGVTPRFGRYPPSLIDDISIYLSKFLMLKFLFISKINITFEELLKDWTKNHHQSKSDFVHYLSSVSGLLLGCCCYCQPSSSHPLKRILDLEGLGFLLSLIDWIVFFDLKIIRRKDAQWD